MRTFFFIKRKYLFIHFSHCYRTSESEQNKTYFILFCRHKKRSANSVFFSIRRLCFLFLLNAHGTIDKRTMIDIVQNTIDARKYDDLHVRT